jgi:hypothetical protein
MGLLVAVLTIALLGAVILLVSSPLRTARRAPDPESIADRAELEAAREAKYREIRDAELDYRTGKLSSKDYAAINAALRAEAIAILDRLMALKADAPGDSQASAPDSSQAPSS